MNNASPSLSVILPVYNSERTLGSSVAQLLEVLEDLSPDFEVVIVDDGSEDQTEEVATELAQSYPQVQVARQKQHRGIESAIRSGLDQAAGEVVIVNSSAAIDSRRIRQMWDLRSRSDVVAAQSGTAPGVVSQDLLEQLAAWGTGVAEAQGERVTEGSVQMIRRPHLAAPITVPSTAFTPVPTW